MFIIFGMLDNLKSIKVAGAIAGISIFFIFKALNIPGMEPDAQGLIALLLAILTPLIALFGVPGKSNIGKAITIAVAMFGMATS